MHISRILGVHTTLPDVAFGFPGSYRLSGGDPSDRFVVVEELVRVDGVSFLVDVLGNFWGGFVLQCPYDGRELDVFLHHDSVDHVTDETDCGLVEMGNLQIFAGVYFGK